MSIFAYTNVKTLAGGYELTSLSNEAKISTSRKDLDVTTFGSAGWEDYIAGLKTIKVSMGGFWSPDTTDAAQFNAIGAAAQDLMLLPTGGADAEPAFVGTGMRGTYQVGGKVGDAAPFSAEWVGAGMSARGTVLKSGSITATSTGTIMNLGALSSTQTAVFQIQCPTVTGTSPTLALIVQSAALVGFGTPTTRATFATLTAAGSQTITLAGPVTDAFWRVSYTVGGSATPTFATYVVAGFVPN